jgi:hypothetical protein
VIGPQTRTGHYQLGISFVRIAEARCTVAWLMAESVRQGPTVKCKLCFGNTLRSLVVSIHAPGTCMPHESVNWAPRYNRGQSEKTNWPIPFVGGSGQTKRCDVIRQGWQGVVSITGQNHDCACRCARTAEPIRSSAPLLQEFVGGLGGKDRDRCSYWRRCWCCGRRTPRRGGWR